LDSVAAALEGRQPYAVTRATTEAAGWEAAAAQQEQGLARALEAATECVVGYAAAQGGEKGMDTSEAALPDAAAGGRLRLAPDAALGAFAEWAGRVGADVAAEETDAALQASARLLDGLSVSWCRTCWISYRLGTRLLDNLSLYWYKDCRD